MTNEEVTIQVKLSEYKLLAKIAEAVLELPFGQSVALPWCRESFPLLDVAMLDWEKNFKKERGI